MSRGPRIAVFSAAGVLAIVVASACGGSSTTAKPAAGKATSTSSPRATPSTTGTAGAVDPNAIETPVPGDIPDTQAFVAVAGPGYTLDVPEGWARSDANGVIMFTDHYNAIRVETAPAPNAPSVASANTAETPQLRRASQGFTLGKVTTTSRRAGPAVLITYQALSAPNPVTAKRVVLDVERYEFWHNGTLATITLSASKGSDNVDPWKKVTDSFAWQA